MICVKLFNMLLQNAIDYWKTRTYNQRDSQRGNERLKLNLKCNHLQDVLVFFFFFKLKVIYLYLDKKLIIGSL